MTRQKKGPARTVRTGPLPSLAWCQAAAASRLPRRLRATRVAAAAPNSRIIGGAGTWVPPVELEEPPLDDELELDELELELLDEEELEPLVLPEPPKLLDPPVAPELVEVLLVDAPELVAPELVEVDEVELWWPPEELELEPPWPPWPPWPPEDEEEPF